MLKIGFLGFDQWKGKPNIGSSRIRCDWPINYWPEAERFKQGVKYDVVIFQKAYWVDFAKVFTGVKILDMCDPDWLDGNKVVEMIQHVDAITTSSMELAKYISSICDKPVAFIPDRIDPSFHRQKKQHVGRAKSAVWFGYAHNFPALDSAVKALADLKLDLIVISNQPYHAPTSLVDKINVINFTWGAETVNDDILRGDIVINPKLPTGRFKFKSDNKTITSWALGMPVALNDKDLKAFVEESGRKAEVEKRLKEVADQYDVKRSVEEYKHLIDEIVKSKVSI